MREPTQNHDPKSMWIVVNECTDLIVSKPCEHAAAEQVREWINRVNSFGYTYTLAPVPEFWDEAIKFWPAPDQRFIVENATTHSTVYQPCAIDEACYIRAWMTRLDPNGHTYAIHEHTSDFVGQSMAFEREWLGWTQQAFRLRTGRELDLDLHFDTLFAEWMHGTMPHHAARLIAS